MKTVGCKRLAGSNPVYGACYDDSRLVHVVQIHTTSILGEVASESDNKEADHSLVNCVGLFKAGGGKDHY